MKLKGKVVQAIHGEGSKSEHMAIYLDTGNKKYRLKKKGGNPFYDDSLNKLVGKTILAEGTVNDYFFVIDGEPEVE